MAARIVCLLFSAALLARHAGGQEPTVRIGADARLPDNPRTHYSRYVNWRPADGETVRVNPPRFSWPYWPDGPKDPADAEHDFTLQISAKADCADPVVHITSPLNFYNTLPLLKGASRWYWRVGYDVGQDGEAWSTTRSFDLAADAVAWDRSALSRPDLAARGHPRILFNARNLGQLRQLARTSSESSAALEHLRREADKVLGKAWWDAFPATDRGKEPKQPFYTIARDLVMVCFVWRLTGDDRYAGVKERAVTWASYPPRGRASPEGLGGDGNEDATQGNEFLALLFDWLYNDLTESERETMIASLEWRIDHWMNSFAWRAKGRTGPMLRVTYRGEGGHLGDRRLRLAPAEEWRQFTWQADVPEGAAEAIVEFFNYYRSGTVWWSGVDARGSETGPGLLRNGVFRHTEGEAPDGWRFNRYKTAGTPEVTAAVDEEGGAVGIRCGSNADRGSWDQKIRVSGLNQLRFAGRYRTEAMSAAAVRATSLSGLCSSHQYEGSMDTAVCGLAAYEHSAIAREWFDLILNYLIGVTCGHGYDEAWNEGAGYGTSKCKWLMNATLYFDTALPEANLGRNPFYRRIGDWFCRVIPVGMDHHAWGNQRNSSRWNHVAHMRKFAFLTGDGRFLLNWQQYGGDRFSKWRPWIEYVLPHYYDQPEPAPESDGVGVFPVGGWGMAASGPPSLRSTFDEGLGLVFQCRPRGGYSHSFNSDASFQLHAYGQMLNHGGGSSANKDAYAYHAMSHNTILVDGLGQAQPGRGQVIPAYGRLAGFSRGDRHVYFAGDATRCYPRDPGTYGRWGLPLHSVYEKRALPHLQRFVRHMLFVRNRYFVIYDDLACSRPATYTWLYHILPDDPVQLDPQAATVDYAVGDVRVRLVHAAPADSLVLEDRRGEDALMNPLTDEDYRKWRVGDILCGHNLWISNKAPARDWSFLAVVYPAPPGQKMPEIRGIGRAAVRVGDDIICFDPKQAPEGAGIVVDAAAMR